MDSQMLIAAVVVIAILFLLPKKGGKFPLITQAPEPVSQREADRKEALELIEAKLVEVDKQNRFAEAVNVVAGLADAKKAAK